MNKTVNDGKRIKPKRTNNIIESEISQTYARAPHKRNCFEEDEKHKK